MATLSLGGAGGGGRPAHTRRVWCRGLHFPAQILLLSLRRWEEGVPEVGGTEPSRGRRGGGFPGGIGSRKEHALAGVALFWGGVEDW